MQYTIYKILQQNVFRFSIKTFSFRQFPFSREQVRILLYQETESNGRKLLFDSNAIQKVNISAESTPADKSYIEISDGIGYKYVKPENDHHTIGEMVFGSVAMAYRGTALKVKKNIF